MTTAGATDPRLSHTVLGQIDEFLEDFYKTAIKAGKQMADNGMSPSQVRGLEALIVSTTRFSEVLNYIKNQAGKETRAHVWKTVAPTLLSQLDEIESKAIEIAKNDPRQKMEIKMRLTRGWARQVVANYLYTAPENRRGE